MKPKAYIETSVVSYLTAWPARDVVIAGHQQTTREWWRDAADRFELVASQLVINEAGAGDFDAAKDRLNALTAVILLDATDEALELAQELISSGAVPKEAAEDAAHIAIAVTNGVDYLVTWNCRQGGPTTCGWVPQAQEAFSFGLAKSVDVKLVMRFQSDRQKTRHSGGLLLQIPASGTPASVA